MTPCLERFAARPGFLDWNDADWGIRHGFLLPEDYAELRFRELDADGPDADDIVALRLADDDDERRDVIRRKASRTPEADERSGRKWAFAMVEAIWLAHKDDPEALFHEVHWFWEWELMAWGVDDALAPGLDRVLGFAPLTLRSRFRSWLQCRLPRGLRRHLWLRDLRRRFVPECSAWLREQEFLLRPVFAEGESVDSLLAKSRRFAKENGMRFDDEPFHNTRGCGFWFRLPRRRWGHAGCAFLKSRVFFYSEAFTFFGRMFERRDREFVPFDRLSAAKLFDYVLDERYRLLDIVRRRCWWRAFLDKRIRKRLRHDSIPPDLVHELECRTAAGEVAPIPDRNRRGFDRSLSAALAQLRLRETKPDLDPVPRMLAEVRRVFVERAICSRPEALSRILPGDSFETLLATQDDTACFMDEILQLGMACGRLADKEFLDCRTIGDLVANMERAEREGRPKPTQEDVRRLVREERKFNCFAALVLLVVLGLFWLAVRLVFFFVSKS